MSAIHAAHALVQGNWRQNVRISIADGRIAGVACDVAAEAGDDHQGIVLPAMPNLHSHAFQRGMAGLAERRHTSSDTFWSWREAMYRLALTISPAQIEAIAGQLYMEMLEAGFSRVGEFHYLHNDVDGRPYENRAELAVRIAAAAAETGIGLTLLPVFYAHASFGGVAPSDSQRRFINSIDSYATLLDGCRAAVKPLGTGVVGVAPHSLRAVTPDELTAVVGMAHAGPIHIHISEQTREVDECIAWSGQRPVDWLLAHQSVDRRWCLVHATHMTGDETKRMAKSGAIAGLCPITEANLGDGVFSAPDFLAAGGRFGIGSDSNIQIGAADELRLLEYSQRLVRRGRNILAPPGHSTGRALTENALTGGSIALGGEMTGLAAGAPADILSLDAAHPALAVAQNSDDYLDIWIFAAGNAAVDCVWVHGKKLVENGRHINRDRINRTFVAVMKELSAA